VFGLAVPSRIPGVPNEVLHPRDAWEDADAYDATAAKLRGAFQHRAREMDIDPEWLGWLND
jgi:phosphoenolpyruvate carboxykinase (ATP)